MASWEQRHWQSDDTSGVPRAARRSGPFHSYLPDLLDGATLSVGGGLSRRVAEVERSLQTLNGSGTEGLTGIARFLLRSEAIASSRIEGIRPSAQQVALAELGQAVTVRGVSEQARLVAANMTVVRRSTTELVETDEVGVDHVVDLHRSLLADQARHHGLRSVQNWIGGSDWSPIGAQFVPPAPEHVEPLMSDLVDYLNGGAHSALVQAAVVHAQFETIHPFTDGNGRVGRALIHTVLTRRGLTGSAVLPISLVLATLSADYVAGLDAFRHAGPPQGREASQAVNAWLSTFVSAAAVAVDVSSTLLSQVEEQRAEWVERLTAHRRARGVRERPRTDSAVARLLTLLPEVPVVTATTLTQILRVSAPAAGAALDELAQAGILHRVPIERGASAFVARDVVQLVTLAERTLASTRFDTRQSLPSRSAPARPDSDRLQG